MDLPRPRPAGTALEGRYCLLELLGEAHCADLHAASSAPDATQRFTWLFQDPPADLADLTRWVAGVAGREDPLYYAVIDRATGCASGRQALMRITPEHGVIEIGNIYWGPSIARTRVATEALYLFARHAFDDLGYRRFEWKCDDSNAPSKAAATRFGFAWEGLFRQHMWVKGKNRDTAWFAMLDAEWPALKAEYERWLDPDNFDAAGRQRTRLAMPRNQPGA